MRRHGMLCCGKLLLLPPLYHINPVLVVDDVRPKYLVLREELLVLLLEREHLRAPHPTDGQAYVVVSRHPIVVDLLDAGDLTPIALTLGAHVDVCTDLVGNAAKHELRVQRDVRPVRLLVLGVRRSFGSTPCLACPRPLDGPRDTLGSGDPAGSCRDCRFGADRKAPPSCFCGIVGSFQSPIFWPTATRAQSVGTY